MRDEFRRCHLFPRCELHKGWVQPRNFSTRNVAEMRAERREGRTWDAIAASFGTHPSTVAAIVRDKP